MAIIVASSLWLTPATYSSKSSRVARVRLSDYCERENILPEEQCGSRPQRPTVGMMFVVRRLQELARKKDTPLYS